MSDGREVAPLSPPSPEDLRALPLPIVACPRCGSLGIRTVRAEEGSVPGTAELLSERICPRCEYRGSPLMFEAREEYAAFLRELSG